MIFNMCLLLLLITTNANPEPIQTTVEERLSVLEVRLPKKPVTSEHLESLEEKLKLVIGTEQLAQGKQWQDLDLRAKRIEDKVDLWLALLILVGLGSGGGFLTIWMKMKGKIDREFSAKLGAQVEVLSKLAEREDREMQILKKERVMVLSRPGGLAYGQLESLHFRQLILETVSEGPLSPLQLMAIPELCYDLVVFDELEAEWINKFIERRPGIIFVAYTTAGEHLKVDQTKVCFANTPVTLYSRVMEAIRFRRQILSAF